MRKEDVTRRLGLDSGDFYITAPAPCPYLEGQTERKVFSYLGGPAAPAVNAMLSQRGFRRSQNIIYMPACEQCKACQPVRIIADAFEPSKSRKRIINKNKTLIRRIKGPNATSEQFSVLRGYLDSRHADGGMSEMTVLDYASMVEETAVDTIMVEYVEQMSDGRERLLACALSDRLPDGLSMVYSFFEPEEAKRSLGQYMILDHIALARELGLPYVYLGYWVRGSQKMDYKRTYEPLEALSHHGWQRV